MSPQDFSKLKVGDKVRLTVYGDTVTGVVIVVGDVSVTVEHDKTGVESSFTARGAGMITKLSAAPAASHHLDQPFCAVGLLGVRLAEKSRDPKELFSAMYDAIYTAFSRTMEDEGDETEATTAAEDVLEKEARREKVTPAEKAALDRLLAGYVKSWLR